MNKPYRSKLITNYVTKDDIDLDNKLNNLYESGEISEDIYNKCQDTKIFTKIEDKIWNLMKNSAEPFHAEEFYDGLAKEYDASDEHDLKSAEVYNCDLLYMTAIAIILGMPRPRSSEDYLK